MLQKISPSDIFLTMGILAQIQLLKWVLKITFTSPMLEVMSGIATLVDSNFKDSIYRDLIVLEVKIEPGSTSLKTIKWEDISPIRTGKHGSGIDPIRSSYSQ
jgi:hypothetical protein